MSGWGSTAPAAIAGVIAALQEAVDAEVTDTVLVTNASTTESVCIAYQSDTQAAIEDAQVDSELGTQSFDRERYAINNVVYVLNGGGDIVAARVRAFDLLGQVGRAVRADSTLGDAVMRAWVGTWSFLPQQTRQGALVILPFSIGIDAYTT